MRVAFNRKISDMYIMSDVDGTLINRDRTIPVRNMEALERFIEKGGHFGLATGRSMLWSEDLVKSLPVNAPCVLFNGGALYDFTAKESFMELILPDECKPMVDVIKKMPYENGIVVMTRENYYNVCSEREMVRELLTVRQADYTQPVGWQTIREPWFKLLVVIKKKDYDGCMEYISKRSVPGTRVISTTYELIEILPEGSSKGNALEAMLEIKEINRENLAVIGDFYNDLEMIRMAGVGAAVAGAPDEVLDEADFISGSCKDGAVADLVEYLESICD